MLAPSSRSGIANHQNSSQSQSSTLIESTQNDKEKTRLFEEARFIAEMSKGDPTMDDFNLLQILGKILKMLHEILKNTYASYNISFWILTKISIFNLYNSQFKNLNNSLFFLMGYI